MMLLDPTSEKVPDNVRNEKK